MYFEDINLNDRKKLGRKLIHIKTEYEGIRELFFLIDEDGEAVAERMVGASELFDVFNMWIRGDDLSLIGESIFQSDEEPIQKILAIVGINDSSR